MVGTITVNPTVTELCSFRGKGSRVRVRRTTKQSKPYTKPAPYYLYDGYVKTSAIDGSPAQFGSPVSGYPTQFDLYTTGYPMCVAGQVFYKQPEADLSITQSKNTAYAKFRDAWGEKAMWLVNAAEARQTADSFAKMVDRLRSLFSLMRQCLLSPRVTARQLNELLRRFPKGTVRNRARAIFDAARRRGASVGDLWLELHFGWEQLVKDCYATFMQYADFKTEQRIHIRGPRIPWTYERSWRSVTSSFHGSGHGYSQCTISATVKLNDVTAYRAAANGLLNPAQVAWELVKFSFVLDWFVNIGQVIDSYTDWCGVSISDSCYTVVSKATSWTGKGAQYSPYFPSGTWTAESEAIYVERKLGLFAPELARRYIKNVSIVRGATAIALLLQELRSHHQRKPSMRIV